MKFRVGFVSNSSSSSFVLIVPKDFDLSIPLPLKLEIGLATLVEEELRSEADLEELMFMNGWDREMLAEWPPYQQVLKALQQGKVILLGSVNSEWDEATPCAYIAKNGFGNLTHYGIETIQDCGKIDDDYRSRFIFAMKSELIPTGYLSYPPFTRKGIPITVPGELKWSNVGPRKAETEAELRRCYLDEQREYEEYLIGWPEYEQALLAIQQGKVVLFGSASNDLDDVTAYVCYHGFGDVFGLDITVIRDCEGF
ncbi:MAG: hypothetical protein ACE5OZ_11450 [Candidatus Heimdallarchaeota archaeon]